MKQQIYIHRNCKGQHVACGSTLVFNMSERRDVSEEGKEKRKYFTEALLLLEPLHTSQEQKRNFLLGIYYQLLKDKIIENHSSSIKVI